MAGLFCSCYTPSVCNRSWSTVGAQYIKGQVSEYMEISSYGAAGRAGSRVLLKSYPLTARSSHRFCPPTDL